MKHRSLALVGLAALLTTAACTHKTPVAAAKAADTTPVASVAPPPARSPQNTTVQVTPAKPLVAPIQRPTTMPPEVRKSLNDALARMEDALFDYDKSTIRDDARGALKDDVAVIRGILNDFPSQKLIIEGHADERGSAEYNVALGDRRAKAAEEFLVSLGIPNNQLTLLSYGKDRPVCTDNTEACWQKNRRAHVTAAP